MYIIIRSANRSCFDLSLWTPSFLHLTTEMKMFIFLSSIEFMVVLTFFLFEPISTERLKSNYNYLEDINILILMMIFPKKFTVMFIWKERNSLCLQSIMWSSSWQSHIHVMTFTKGLCNSYRFYSTRMIYLVVLQNNVMHWAITSEQRRLFLNNWFQQNTVDLQTPQMMQCGFLIEDVWRLLRLHAPLHRLWATFNATCPNGLRMEEPTFSYHSNNAHSVDGILIIVNHHVLMDS